MDYPPSALSLANFPFISHLLACRFCRRLEGQDQTSNCSWEAYENNATRQRKTDFAQDSSIRFDVWPEVSLQLKYIVHLSFDFIIKGPDNIDPHRKFNSRMRASSSFWGQRRERSPEMDGISQASLTRLITTEWQGAPRHWRKGRCGSVFLGADTDRCRFTSLCLFLRALKTWPQEGLIQWCIKFLLCYKTEAWSNALSRVS